MTSFLISFSVLKPEEFMNIEAVSESTQDIDWNDKKEMAVWNGRDLTPIDGKRESWISDIALQRVQFKNAKTGFILCKNERDSGSSSESKQSDDKSSKSDSESKRSDDKSSKSDSKTADNKDSKLSDTKQSVSVVGKTSKDNQGRTSSSAHGRYSVTHENEDGTSFKLDLDGGFERRNDGNQLSDMMSGEITASYNF